MAKPSHTLTRRHGADALVLPGQSRELLHKLMTGKIQVGELELMEVFKGVKSR